MTKIAMISQPMRDLSNDEIEAVRQEAIKKLEDMGYYVLNTFFKDQKAPPETNSSVYALSRSVESMSRVDGMYFVDGWKEARGCRIEHRIAEDYGIEIIKD